MPLTLVTPVWCLSICLVIPVNCPDAVCAHNGGPLVPTRFEILFAEDCRMRNALRFDHT